MVHPLSQYKNKIRGNYSSIPSGRKGQLQSLSDYIKNNLSGTSQISLVFICTHNSRRSHFCQIWFALAIKELNLTQLSSFSGGTEATAFNPRAVAAVERAGLKVIGTISENPVYHLMDESGQAFTNCFSKVYNDPSNPQDNFIAVMTCDHADQNCPFIPGAMLRVPIRYLDPKSSDGTPQEATIYDHRCFQIATEMFYLAEQINKP